MSQTDQTDIDALLALLNKWRHFASYQLEPRADAIFALFLPVVFEKCLKIEIHPEVIPQFPLKKSSHNNEAFRVDFLALSKDGERAFLIELKTDMAARNDDQDKYLKEAMDKGMARILAEFMDVAKAKKDKGNRQKYFHITSGLSELGVFALPCKLEDVMYADVSRGVFDLIDKIKVTPPGKLEVVYIQPKDEQSSDCRIHYISFDHFANVMESEGKMGELFASYLRKWTRMEAGQLRPSQVRAAK